MVPEPTVEILNYQCDTCDTHIGPTHHDDATCDGPILNIDGDWRCGHCGIGISPADTCLECGAEISPTSESIPLGIELDATPSTIEEVIHVFTNERRQDHSVGEIEYSHHLSAIALQHSRDMAVRDYFDHESPDREVPIDRYRKFDAESRQIGENIAMETISPTSKTKDIAESIVSGWMNSPPHRETLLYPEFRSEGIGVYCRSDGTMYVTQNFQ